jgi:hypothetical protein
MNIETISAVLEELDPDETSVPKQLLKKLSSGEPLTPKEAVIERLAHLAYATGCPEDFHVIRFLFDHGFVEWRPALTAKAIGLLLEDLERR